MLAGLPAQSRRGHVAPPLSLTGAAVLGRAVRVLRTPTQAACALRAHARARRTFAYTRRRGLTATRFKPTPLRDIRTATAKRKAGQQDETESPLHRRRDPCDPASPRLQERHRWGSAPTPRSTLLVGRRPTLTATGRSALPHRHAGHREASRTRDTIRSAIIHSCKTALALDLRARLGEKVHQGIF